MTNTSPMWQQAAHTTYQLSCPSCLARAIHTFKSLTFNENIFWELFGKTSDEWTINRKMIRQKEQAKFVPVNTALTIIIWQDVCSVKIALTISIWTRTSFLFTLHWQSLYGTKFVLVHTALTILIWHEVRSRSHCTDNYYMTRSLFSFTLHWQSLYGKTSVPWCSTPNQRVSRQWRKWRRLVRISLSHGSVHQISASFSSMKNMT